MKIFAGLSLALIFGAHAQEGSAATNFFYAHQGARAAFDGMYLKAGKLTKPVEVD